MPAQDPATEDQVRQELSRVLASPQFADSPRLSRFLAYIVEKGLAQDTGQMKEYTIGLAVFDRPADFDPRLDTIVRVQASKLRTRLNDCNACDDSSSPVKIRLPRGSYVPVFEHRIEAAALPETKAPAASRQPARHRFWWAVAVAGIAALIGGFISAVVIGPHATDAQIVRFAIAAPAGCRFDGPLQISPDGHRLVAGVFLIAEADTAIYLYNFESGSGDVLRETKGGVYPYWLPGGNSIVFTKASRLYRLDLGGGAQPSAMGPGDSTWGLDWNRTGAILMGGNPGPVWRLSLPGGTVTAVTAVNKPEVLHLYPRFLPDGNRFLYLARNETPGDSAIYLGSLDGKLKKRVLESETKALFVPAAENPTRKGYILFARGGALLARPFDLTRSEVTGAARQVAVGIPQIPYGASPFSAASGVVAYTTNAGAPAQLTWFDRIGKVAGKLGPIAHLGDPAISPDGAFVAYDQSEGSNRDIWTVEVNSGKTMRITFNPEVDHTPSWSPDGGRIAFESHRDPPGLYVTASQGGSPESLVLPGGDSPSDWASDGRFLLFDSMRSEPEPHSIWLLPLGNGRKPQRWLRPAVDIRWPVLSPDRKWIAYSSIESGHDNVYVQAFDANRTPGPGKWQVSVGGGSQPVWRNDGKELFYLSPDNVLMAVAVTPGVVFKYDRPIPLFDTRIRALRGPRNDYITRDGKRFLIRIPAETGPAPPIHVVVNWSKAAFGND